MRDGRLLRLSAEFHNGWHTTVELETGFEPVYGHPRNPRVVTNWLPDLEPYT